MSMNSSISLFVRLYLRVESVCVLGEGNGITFLPQTFEKGEGKNE